MSSRFSNLIDYSENPLSGIGNIRLARVNTQREDIPYFLSARVNRTYRTYCVQWSICQQMAQMIVAGLRIILQSNMSIYLPRWRILTTNKATIWLARVNRLRLKGGIAAADELL